MVDSQNRALPLRSLYEKIIKRRVCSKCIDFGEDGVCHTQDPNSCAIFRFLPELVAISERLHEFTMESYINAVRADICSKCRDKMPDAACELRGKIDCGLDRYLELIFEALDEANAVRKRKEKKSRN